MRATTPDHLTTALAGVVLVIGTVLLATGLGWALRHYVPIALPPEIPATARVHFAGSGVDTARALEALAALPRARRKALIASLRANLVSLPDWLAGMRAAPYPLVCLGERHAAATRRFIGTRLLPGLPADVLMLEESATRMARLNLLHQESGPPLLLGAPILDVLLGARRANPGVIVEGIDETPVQKILREEENIGTRDYSIVVNFRSHFRPGKRHVILFGALHCSTFPGWMFERLRHEETRLSPAQMLNVTVLARHDDRAIESFANFIENVGIGTPTFVVAHTHRLDPIIYRWFPMLKLFFAPFRAAVVFGS